MKLTDIELARLYQRIKPLPPPGSIDAPCALGQWDGRNLRLRPSGAGLAPEAAALSPDLAEALGGTNPLACLPGGWDAVAALEADYTPVSRLAGASSAHEFAARLAACRACSLWREKERGGRGRCDHAGCGCDRRLLWAAAERCPAGKW